MASKEEDHEAEEGGSTRAARLRLVELQQELESLHSVVTASTAAPATETKRLDAILR